MKAKSDYNKHSICMDARDTELENTMANKQNQPKTR